jgi:3-hydroxyisobutyrate dehydrogenase-like beta-hydroxyacid dehydrogenase
LLAFLAVPLWPGRAVYQESDALKDFGLMLKEGERLGVPLPLTSVAHQLCTAASAAGHGDEDLAAVITTLEYLAGIGS